MVVSLPQSAWTRHQLPSTSGLRPPPVATRRKAEPSAEQPALLPLLAACSESAAAEVAALLCDKLADVAALASVCPTVASALHNRQQAVWDASPTSSPDFCCSILRFATQSGLFPLETAGTQNPLILASTTGRVDVVRFLIYSAGAAIDATDDHGATALHYAALGDQEHVCSVLLEAGADSNASDRDNIRPLHLAAECGHACTVAALLVASAIVDARDRSQNTPMLLAAEGGHVHACAILVAAGAGIHRTNIAGRSALGVAKESGEVDLTRTLTQPPSVDIVDGTGVSPSRLKSAIATARAETRGEVIAARADTLAYEAPAMNPLRMR